MAYKLPGGVTVYTTPEEARAAGAIDKVEQGSDGNLYATPHQGWLLRNMPWLVMGTMAAGAGAAAAGVGAGAGAGAGAAPVGAAGTAAGTGAGVAAGTGAAASAGFWSPATIGLIGTGIGAGTNLIGAHMASTAAGRAAALQQQANAESLAFLKDQDARDFAEYLKERGRIWGNEDVDRARAEEDRQLKLKREGEREGRLAPFREGAADGYKTLAGLLRPPVAGMVSYGPPVSNATTRGSLADLLRG